LEAFLGELVGDEDDHGCCLRVWTSMFITSTCTASPCWLSVVLFALTKPCSGREREARTSSTSPSTRSSSPGRTARGQDISSARVPMMPPAGSKGLPTRRFIVRAAGGPAPGGGRLEEQ